MNQQQRIMVDSVGKKAETIVQTINVVEMKTKNQILKWLAMLLLVIASTMGVMAAENQDPKQNACPGPEPYRVEVIPATGNDYLWTVFGGTAGIDYTISSITTSSTTIIWAHLATTKIFIVTFKEIDPVTGCYDEVNVEVTVNPAPDAPISGGDLVQCEQLPIQILTATATAPAGSTVIWYTAAVDGTLVPSPTLNTIGTITYYAESVVTVSGCTSLTRIPVTLTINPAPVVPISGGDITACEQSPLQTLTATATAPTGATITWYNAAIGGTLVADPSLSVVGTITYYAESVITIGGCSSLTRTPVKLTIEPAPVAPTAGLDQVACEQSPLQTLTATATPPTGATIAWYDAATGGNLVALPTLNTVGTITYYAQSELGTCSSLTRTPVKLTIDPAPVAPTAGLDQVACEQSPLQTLTATATPPAGATIAWYDASTGGNLVALPTLNTVGTITYYAQSELGSCSSLTRTPVKLTIDPAPLAPTAGLDQVACEQSPLQTLTATATAPTGATVAWYDAATGGNLVALPTLNTVGTITYYAQSELGTCSSLTRTAVKLTILPAPDPTVTGPTPICAATTGHVYKTEPGMTDYVWAISAGGSITAGGSALDNTITVTWKIAGPQTVSVNYKNANGCSAAAPKVMNVTVHPLPVTSPIYHN